MAAYDMVVIGSGAAGATAATTAVHQGASSVAIVEQGPLWGTCVNNGCIPSKFLLTLAEYYYYKNHGHAGIRTDSRFNLYVALAEKDALIGRLKQKKTDRIITDLNIEIIEGSAEFLSSTGLQVGNRKVTADRIIIATGSSPQVPPVPGIHSVPFMTNVEALNPERIPDSLIVIGGRALGLEFAQLYSHLGTKVTLLQRSARIIPEEEPELADLLAGYLRDEGIDIRTGAEIRGVEKTAEGVAVTVTIGGTLQVFSSERLLLATGRSPNTKGLRLDRAGVKTGPKGAVLVDASLRTSAPSIWAAGDVTGEPMLETSARYAGEIAAMNAFQELKRSFNRSFIPHGIYTMPQVAGVGLTEAQARTAGLNPETRTLRMDTLARSFMIGDTRGVVKIVVSKADGCVLGVHACSPLATEILQASVLAVIRHLPVNDLADMYHIFPTTGEAISLCARQFRKNTGGTCSD
ncbi:dihydrolipoyl dehydrogenase family protein [Methanoregula sp.]|uniref:dihydrolipoyl dehydrogenase family protein n=1 Tax=Methanoregula sp. TaxID=2052170 RepID=UPI003C7351D1